MTLHIHRIDGEYRIVLSEGEMEALRLADGDPVTVVPGIEEPGQDFEYVSTAEAMQAFEDTYADHESSYLELAK